MSFPNIPDINPYINIKFEDSINLLLTSIAMEELSLSKLMDAETNKILCVLNDCKPHDCKNEHCGCCGSCSKSNTLQDALEINKSVDDMIKNMIKLQMLLQFKFDNIKEILPCTSSTTTTSTSTSTTSTCTRTTTTKTTSSTTTTHTTTCTTSTCSTTTKMCCCDLTGSGKGCVSNCCDEFYGQMASLYAFVYSSDVKNRAVRYSVGDDQLCLYASGQNVKIECPCQCPEKLVIYGKGQVYKNINCKPVIVDKADYILTVGKRGDDILEFRMEILPYTKPEFIHDSGLIRPKGAASNLQLTMTC